MAIYYKNQATDSQNHGKDFSRLSIEDDNMLSRNIQLVRSRPVGWRVLWVRTDPPTEAIEFHLAWLKQGSKVCKDNKPYAAICFK